MKKKIVICLAVFLLVLGIAGTFWGQSIAEAASGIWNSCSKGKVNCEYPGDCRSYIDTNKDSICDRSQSQPVESSATSVQTTVAAASTVNTAPSTIAAAASTVNTAPSTIAAAAVVSTPASSASAGEDSNTSLTTAGTAEKDLTEDTGAGLVSAVSNGGGDSSGGDAVDGGNVSESGSIYYFIPVFTVLMVFYLLTWVLSWKGIIARVLHRRIWNVVLLISTLISALLGLFLILSIDHGIEINLPFNMLFWHVEAGIAMGAIAVLHILWHWRYFAKIVQAVAAAEKPEKAKVKPPESKDPSLVEAPSRIGMNNSGK